MLALPCVNGGVAVGLGLDYQWALWTPLLHPGDTVYMPLELRQYEATKPEARLGPDAAIMLRHDRGLLLSLGPARAISALFSGTVEDAIASLVEELAVTLHPALAHPAFAETDEEGDGSAIASPAPGATAPSWRACIALIRRSPPLPRAMARGRSKRSAPGRACMACG